MAEILRTPRGTKDILPDEQKYWRFVSETVAEKCEGFGFGKIDLPIFEYAEVFTKGLGNTSDIITKEMYEVRRAISPVDQDDNIDNDKTDKTLVLRPEMTAAIVRSYIEHGMKIWSQPVKLYYMGPYFRYERPQAGRLRQFHQFGAEIIGDDDALADASIIYLGYQILKKLGLADKITVDINSVGDASCRTKIKKKLTDYFENFLPEMCPDCNRRYTENPLRILDCKEEKCQKIIAGAPQLVDMLCPTCKTHFKQVLENLDYMQIPYNLNPGLVRGLDYYTRTVFEFYEINDTNRQSTLLGGGRYDKLIKAFGEQDTPAVGFAGGVERIIDKIKNNNVAIPEKQLAEVCIIQIGDKARRKTLGLLNDLEKTNIKATAILGKESLKGQLRMAAKIKAQFALIMGQKEAINNSVILRDMIDGSQETYKLDKLVDLLRAKLGK